MKKHYILTLLFIFGSFLNTKAQQYFSIPNDLKESHRSVKDAFTITNPDTKNLSLFIDDNKTLNAYIYNENLQRIDSLVSDRLPSKYNEVIGYIQKENKTILFLKNIVNKKFGAIIFDFGARNTKKIEFNFKLEKGEYLESLSKDNKFYLITAVKDRSALKIYEFKGTFPRTHYISLNDYLFKIADNKRLNLFEMVKNLKKMNSNPVELRKVETDFPVSMELAGAMNKIYKTNKGFDLMLDKSIDETYIISVNLTVYKAKITSLEKPKYTTTEHFFSKSFLLDNTIYQIIGNSDEVYFEAKNKETGKILKNLHINKKELIPFKNTSFIKNGNKNSFSNYRDSKRTSKFLRKIDNENITTSVLKQNNNYIVSIGSYTDTNQGSTNSVMGPGGSSFAVSSGIIENSISSYASYANGRSIKIKCLFDSDFDHVKGEVPENIFDRIKNYASLLQYPIAENVFKWNGTVYYGYYNSDNETYRITKF